MAIRVARDAFKENVGLIDPNADPVTYNLNVGLYNLALEIDKMQETLGYLGQKVDKLKK